MSVSEAEMLGVLPELPRDEGGPVFSEPWEAQVFSIVCVLHENGLFSWHEWAETLGASIKELPVDTPYYKAWLSALEKISLTKKLVEPDQLIEQKNAWDRAAKATPHGEPIELGGG